MTFGKRLELNVFYHLSLNASKYNTPVKICSRSNFINANIFDFDEELGTRVTYFDAVCVKREITLRSISTVKPLYNEPQGDSVFFRYIEVFVIWRFVIVYNSVNWDLTKNALYRGFRYTEVRYIKVSLYAKFLVNPRMASLFN